MTRKEFISTISILSAGACFPFSNTGAFYFNDESEFGRHIKPVGRALEIKDNNRQFEDAFVWREKKKFKMIARDMGIYNHEDGIIMYAKDGTSWTEPKIAYYGADKYIKQPPAPPHLKKYGRFERPQILFHNDKPAYLFTTSRGGKYMTSSPYIFRIES